MVRASDGRGWDRPNRWQGLRGWGLLPILVVALGGWVPKEAGAAVTCSARLDRHTVRVGEQVVLTLDVEGDVRSIAEPRLPDFGPFEVYGGGQSQSFSFVNGQIHTSRSYTWYLRPLKEGEYELPPIEVVADGKTYRTRKIPLSVTRGSPGASPPSAGTPGKNGGGLAPRRRPGGPAGVPGGEGSRALDTAGVGAVSRGGRVGDDFFITMSVDRDTVVVGEQIVLTFSFYRSIGASIFSRPQYTPPTTEGFWREDLPPERHDSITLGGQPYEVTRILYALFPTREGELEVGTAEVRIPDDAFDSFFRRSRRRGEIILRAPAIPVLVRQLPPGKPDDFTGTVGEDLKLSIQTDRKQLAVGDALTVSLELRGEGYLASAGKPRLPRLDGFRAHDSGSSLDSRPIGGRLQGRLRVESLLIPQKAGDFTIPPVRYSYFDTGMRRYVTLSTEAVKLRVTPSGEGAVQSFSTGGKSEIEILSQDILHIQPITADLRPYPGEVLRRRSTWILVALPPFLLVISSMLARRRRILLADPARLRAQKALGNARRLLKGPGEEAQRASGALMQWLADKTDRAPAGLSSADMERWLDQRAAPEDLRRSVLDFLQRADRARFGAASSDGDLLAEAGRLLLRLEEEVGRG